MKIGKISVPAKGDGFDNIKIPKVSDRFFVLAAEICVVPAWL